MRSASSVRPVQPTDYAAWRPLWDGYNAFYGRFGATAVPDHITQTTWQRFLDDAEPMYCLVAQDPANGELLGLAHYIFHRSTTRMQPVCYLSDLFTREAARGRGVGRALIDAVGSAARMAQSSRVYWQTTRPMPPDACCTTSWRSTMGSSSTRKNCDDQGGEL